MKYFLLFLLFIQFTIAQNLVSKDSIIAKINEYNEAIEKDMLKSLDFMYPKLFELVSKEEFENSINAMKNDENIDIGFKNRKLNNISEIIDYQGIKYSIVDYSYVLFMGFKNENREILEMTLKFQEEKYGKENVILRDSTFEIKINNKMFAILDPIYKEWKLLEFKKDKREILEKIIPKKALKMLKI